MVLRPLCKESVVWIGCQQHPADFHDTRQHLMLNRQRSDAYRATFEDVDEYHEAMVLENMRIQTHHPRCNSLHNRLQQHGHKREREKTAGVCGWHHRADLSAGRKTHKNELPPTQQFEPTPCSGTTASPTTINHSTSNVPHFQVPRW